MSYISVQQLNKVLNSINDNFEKINAVTDTELGFVDGEDITEKLQLFINKNKYKTLIFTKGKKYIVGSINITRKDLSFCGQATLKNDTNGSFTINQEGCRFEDLIFDKVAIVLPYIGKDFNKKTIIKNNTFKNNVDNANISAIQSQIGYNDCSNNIMIINNTFENNTYNVYGGFKNSLIANNKFIGIDKISRNIEFLCGYNNNIIFNNINGGKIGITSMPKRNISTKLGFVNNYIGFNTITNIAEESISLDTYGDSSEGCSTLLTTTINSISSKWLILNTTFTQYVPVDMYAVILDGDNAGQYSKIQYTGTYTDRIEVPDPSIFKAGDTISILIPVMNNKICQNYLYKTGCICLWGNAINTEISGNILNQSFIKVCSLFGLLGTRNSMCFNTAIKNNYITNGRINITSSVYSDATIINSKNNIPNDNVLIKSTILYKDQEDAEYNNTFLSTIDDNVLKSIPITKDDFVLKDETYKATITNILINSNIDDIELYDANNVKQLAFCWLSKDIDNTIIVLNDEPIDGTIVFK